MVTEIDPVQEWNQIFNEAWRRYRDWFYARNMHGFDWAQIREDYKKWLPYVAHRSDLNYVISEMASELTVQHAYIDGGDFNLPPRVRVALAGSRSSGIQVEGDRVHARVGEAQSEVLVKGMQSANVRNDHDACTARLLGAGCEGGDVRAVGDRERVLAGTDCGFGTIVGDTQVSEDVVWAKLAAMRDGAAIASKRLWG